MSDEQQIRALMQTWLEATKAGDTARVLELIASGRGVLASWATGDGRARGVRSGASGESRANRH